METNKTNKHLILRIITYCIVAANIVINATLLIINRNNNTFYFGDDYLVIIFLVFSIYIHFEYYRLKYKCFCGDLIKKLGRYYHFYNRLTDYEKEFIYSEEYNLIFRCFQTIHISCMSWYLYLMFVCETNYKPWASLVTVVLSEILSHAVVYPVVTKVRVAKENELAKIQEAKDEQFKKDQEEQKKREELGDWRFKV